MIKKVALVHDFLNQLGGAERVLFALSKIYPNAPIYTLDYNVRATQNKFVGKKIITPHYPWFVKILPYRLRLIYYPIAIESFDFSQFDLVISSSNAWSKNIITPPQTTHICYCHSPTRYLWDWTHEYARENGLDRGLRSILYQAIVLPLRLWDFYGRDRVDIYLANSFNTTRRIKKYYRVSAKVVYPPVDIGDSKPARSGKYFLIVSRLSPYKKIGLALQACKILNLPLIIVGTGGEYKKLQKVNRGYKNIKFAGFVHDRELKKYYQNAIALIFPGEEDFGITPVEAMGFGKPVIAYKKGGLLETVIDGKTGIFFEEQSVASLCKAIIKFNKTRKKFNPKIIANHAKKFNEQRFIKEIRNIVRRST